MNLNTNPRKSRYEHQHRGSCKRIYLTPFDITGEQIEETVIDEDVRKTMNLGNLVVVLLLKKFDNYYIFVMQGRILPFLR